jgi:hypothetical protein
MTFEFRDARRQDVSLLILLAGGTGSGKTESALRLATGLAAGKPFAVIDTEHGRALHKADDYAFKHTHLDEPFTPERYAEAVKDADNAGYPVIVIDSGSHEYEGIGGVLEMQTAEFERMGSRDSARISSWIEPKRRHKRFMQELLRARPHVILCLRAEDKIEVVKQDGKTVVRPKESLIGADGWIPICEKRLPFEATISLLLTADAPGVPKPIKLERRHQELVPLDRPLDEKVGAALAGWAQGSGSGMVSGERTTAFDRRHMDTVIQELDAIAPSPGLEDSPAGKLKALTTELIELSEQLGMKDQTLAAITRNRDRNVVAPDKHVAWLEGQVKKARAAVVERADAQGEFPLPTAPGAST